ncbi:hypothetical protein PTKIN_Ptkin03bG0217500 [Pterospermum kingtungense]
MVPNSYQWDFELLDELFTGQDTQEIASIPLVHISVRDRRVWCDCRDGQYSVKTGYKRASQLLSNDVDYSVLAGAVVHASLDFLCSWLRARDLVSTHYSTNIMVDRYGASRFLWVFVSCQTLWFTGLFEGHEAEAVGLYHALEWISSSGFKEVIF